MDDIVSEFIDETIQGLTALDMDLVVLESEPDNMDILGNIFRVMHTIKGTCGFIGLPRLEKLAHISENLLDALRGGKMAVSEQVITVLLMSLDRVRYIVTEIQTNGAEPKGDDTDLISLIEAEMSGDNTNVMPDTPVHTITSDITVDLPMPAAEEIKNIAPPPAKAEATSEYLRVQMNVLEDLINKVSELVLARNQINQILKTGADDHMAVQSSFQSLNRIVSDLQDRMMQTRMQPVGNAWTKFPRLVRDLSRETGKKITLEMHGEETELDRHLLELVKDPLTHMVRNSCDHGIETPDIRVAAGKPETGRLTLRAYHEGGFVIVKIEDDGKGLDPKTIGQKALEKGLVTQDRLDKMSDKEILSFIMAAGFSTAQNITSVSGRGVGMDVVRANIEKMGGMIDMVSVVGEGTCFTIQIPLTLAIIPALVVAIDGIKYALPQINVQKIISLEGGSPHKIEKIDGKAVMCLPERTIALLNADMLFNRGGRDTVIPDDGFVAIVQAGSNYFGIVIDATFDMEEIVIKPVPALLRNVGIFSGTAILGDGQVLMVLEMAAIARQFGIGNEESAFTKSQQKEIIPAETAIMLVFKAGDGIQKVVPIGLVSRLHVFAAEDVMNSGKKIIAKYDDILVPLHFIDPDTQRLSENEVKAIILRDDMSNSVMGLIIDDVFGVVESNLDLTPSSARDGFLGSLILKNGDVADVMDITHFLDANRMDWFSSASHRYTSFARIDDIETGMIGTNPINRRKIGATHGGAVRVLVVDDSMFFRNMLFPILSSAGYEVTLAENAVEAVRMHDEGKMFDIIISDIEMPHMTGYEFVSQMRRDSAWKDLPFIAMTSHNTKEDIAYGYQKGFDYYIGKFDRADLFECLADVQGGA